MDRTLLELSCLICRYSVFLVLLMVEGAFASTWTRLVDGNGSGFWGESANWSGGMANGVDAVADFSTLDLTTDSEVSNTIPRTVGHVLFGDTTPDHNWWLKGSKLTLAVSQETPVIDVRNQTVTVSTVLAGTQGFVKAGPGTLVLESTNSYTGTTVIAGGALSLGELTIPGGTVGYWQFDNAADPWVDSSGQTNTLHSAGGSPIHGLGRIGGGLYLDGNCVMTTAGFPCGVLTGSSAYTIAVWEKTDVGCSNNGGFVGWGINSPNLCNNLRLNGPNSLSAYWFANDFVVGGLPINPMDGNWHSIVVTWDGATQVMYVDGASVGHRTPGNLPAVAPANFVVGKTTADVNFKGWTDELLIANRAWSPEEVSAYQSGGLSGLNILPADAEVEMPGGALIINAAQTVQSLAGAAGASVLLNGGSLMVSNTADASFNGTIGGLGSLAKLGAGRWRLNGSNTFAGMVSVGEGVLTLGSTGSIAQAQSIAVASGAHLDVSEVIGGFRLANGQTLGGPGLIMGTVTVNGGGTVQPSSGNGTATLTVDGGLDLAGTLVMNINRSGEQMADRINAQWLALGGRVVVRNVGATPVLGDSFQLFSVSHGITNLGFFPVLPPLGTGVHWDYSQLELNGTIRVASGPPTLFDVRSYGARGDGLANDYPSINSAIQAAIATGAGSTVYIPGGKYLLNSGQPLRLRNAEGITVLGETNTLLINGGLNDVFVLENASNLTIKMIKIDTQPMRFTQGIVNSLAPDGRSMIVTIDPGFPSFDEPLLADANQTVFWTDPNSLAFDRNVQGDFNFAGARRISGDQWTVYLTNAVPAKVVAKKFAVWNAFRGGGWAMGVYNNTGPIYISDFTYYGGGSGACVGMNNNRGPIFLTRVTVGAPPGSGRIISASGAFNSQGNRAPVTLDGCDVSLTQEDTLDIGTDLSHILAANSPVQIVVENAQGFEVGDTVQIWDWTYGYQHVRDTAVVTSVARDGANWVLTVDHPVEIKKTGPGPGNTNWSAQEQDGIDRCVSLQNASPFTVIRNSRFQTSGRTFVIKAANCLIENNLFYQTPWNIFAAAETFWHGGPDPLNLTIQNNVFDDVSVAPIQVEVRASLAAGRLPQHRYFGELLH